MNQTQLGNMQPGPRIDAQMIKDAQLVQCECGGKVFVEKMILKRISSIVTGTGKVQYFPMNIIVCETCGLMPRELDSENMIPEEFKTKIKTN